MLSMLFKPKSKILVLFDGDQETGSLVRQDGVLLFKPAPAAALSLVTMTSVLHLMAKALSDEQL